MQGNLSGLVLIHHLGWGKLDIATAQSWSIKLLDQKGSEQKPTEMDLHMVDYMEGERKRIFKGRPNSIHKIKENAFLLYVFGVKSNV